MWSLTVESYPCPNAFLLTMIAQSGYCLIRYGVVVFFYSAV